MTTRNSKSPPLTEFNGPGWATLWERKDCDFSTQYWEHREHHQRYKRHRMVSRALQRGKHRTFNDHRCWICGRVGANCESWCLDRIRRSKSEYVGTSRAPTMDEQEKYAMRREPAFVRHYGKQGLADRS